MMMELFLFKLVIKMLTLITLPASFTKFTKSIQMSTLFVKMDQQSCQTKPFYAKVLKFLLYFTASLILGKVREHFMIFSKIQGKLKFFLLAESWLVFPEVTSESMRLALDCFYSLSSRNSNKDLILEFEEILFSNYENPIVNDDSFWEVVCKKDQFG